jgi:hypothetical protein
MGEPPEVLRKAVLAGRAVVLATMERAIRKSGDVTSSRARWAVQQGDLGPSAVPSLSGLIKAVERGPEAIWRSDELPGVSMLVSMEYLLGQDEDVIVRPRVAPKFVRPPRSRAEVDEAVHAPTRANDGRPPPTTVWAPDRLPVVREAERMVKGKGRRVRVNDEMAWFEQDDAWSDDDEYAGSD